ncbi:MAG: hypothetical protein OEY11_15255 [Gammaproteobacteria bacterium]|nr:hypothetical protein [Gammaproteobacteria bacterium]
MNTPGDFVGVAGPKAIYIGMGDKSEFDQINRPATKITSDAGKEVSVKTVEQEDVTVIFQFWHVD